MSVRRDGSVIRLEGDCPVEEAEALTALLEADGDWTIDVSLCRHLHTALVQALLRFRPRIVGEPENRVLRMLILPAIRTHDA